MMRHSLFPVQVCAVVNWILNTVAGRITRGRHIYYLSLDQINRSLKLSYPCWTILLWGVSLVKISVVLLLLRFKQNPVWQFGLKALIAGLLAIAITGTITQLLQCNPISSNWNLLSYTAHCWPRGDLAKLQYTYTGMYTFCSTTKSNTV